MVVLKINQCVCDTTFVCLIGQLIRLYNLERSQLSLKIRGANQCAIKLKDHIDKTLSNCIYLMYEIDTEKKVIFLIYFKIITIIITKIIRFNRLTYFKRKLLSTSKKYVYKFLDKIVFLSLDNLTCRIHGREVRGLTG
jgi:hypothetical protein